MANHAFLIYEVATYVALTVHIHPFLQFGAWLIIVYFGLGLKLQVLSAFSAIFFASILRKKTNNTRLADWRVFLVLIYIYVYDVNEVLAVALQIYIDSYVFEPKTYQQKTYNRIALYLIYFVWGTTVDEKVLVTLLAGVGHGFVVNKIL